MPEADKKIIHELKVIKQADQEIAKEFSLITASKTQVQKFFDFIRSSSVLGLAVGIVLGGAVGVMVKSLIDNVVMPPLGFLFGSSNGLNGLAWTIGKTANKTPVVLHYGMFLNDLANFIVIALVIYLIINLLGVGKAGAKKK